MPIEACKTALIDLLSNKDLKVVALSGAWGTGKTYLWETVQRESEDELLTSAASTSLFGVRDIASLKMKAIQSAAFKDFTETPTGRSLSQLLSAGVKALKEAHASFGALNDLALLLLPKALKGKLIVIDDIERKHDDLTADEVLGFIDECCKRYDCRVLLILNEDRLADRELWSTFREKVIDAEVRLETSPSEALAIALELTPSRYAEHIKAAAERCSVSNIRILRRVIRACNLILSPYEPAHESTLTRAIPSIVLLGFAHFKGVPDPPNLEFALAPTDSWVRIRRAQERDQHPPTEQEKAEEHWQAWLQKVGLQFTNELEAEIVKFYRSGHLEASAVSDLLEANERDHQRFSTQTRASAFLTNCLWYPSRTDQSLLDEARQLIDGAEYMDASMATSLCNTVQELVGGAEVGEDMIDAWLAHFHARLATSEHELQWYREQPRRSPLHPRISQAISGAIVQRNACIGVAQSCSRIYRERAWSDAETSCLSEAPASAYLEAIRTTEGMDLIAIMSEMTSIAKVSLDAHPQFGPAGRRFSDACKTQIAELPESRLTKLIVHLFKADQLGHML